MHDVDENLLKLTFPEAFKREVSLRIACSIKFTIDFSSLFFLTQLASFYLKFNSTSSFVEFFFIFYRLLNSLRQFLLPAILLWHFRKEFLDKLCYREGKWRTKFVSSHKFNLFISSTLKWHETSKSRVGFGLLRASISWLIKHKSRRHI